MKITIDTEICKKHGKDIGIIMYLASLAAGEGITVDTFERARQTGMLKFMSPYNPRNPFPKDVKISDSGQYTLERMIAYCATEKEPEDRFIKLADELRKLFPAGKKPGYAYTWRDSSLCIAERLRKFITKYGNYSDESIIDATKRYVASFNGNYKYMQLLKYFIWKNKTTGEEMVNGRIIGEVERVSQLASYLEDDEEGNTTQEWDVRIC